MPKAPPMRHFNSAEERARREEEPQAGRTGGFRHFNHPEEIARRKAAGEPSRAVVVPPRLRPEAPAWPPPGRENTASVVVTTAVPAPLVTLGFTPDELRELRRILNNYPALETAHVRLTHRVRDIELTLSEPETAPDTEPPKPPPPDGEPEPLL